MKFRKPLLGTIAGISLLCSAASFAQDAPPPLPIAPTSSTPPVHMAQPMPATEPMQTAVPMPASPSSMPAQTGTATMPTPQGELTVHSSMPPAPPAGPAPSFEQLSAGGKSISEDQAAAYPLLANDFIYADHNRNQQISKTEYQNWLLQK